MSQIRSIGIKGVPAELMVQGDELSFTERRLLSEEIRSFYGSFRSQDISVSIHKSESCVKMCFRATIFGEVLEIRTEAAEFTEVCEKLFTRARKHGVKVWKARSAGRHFAFCAGV